jgi:hypothetical protein
MARRAVAVATLALCILLTGTSYAPAYNYSGHYYSIEVILDSDFAGSLKSLSAEDRALVGYCRELPDLSKQLSAVNVYEEATLQPNVFNWIRWAAFDSVVNDDYRQMVAVEQLLHALTGGDSAGMRTVALGILRHLLDGANGGLPDSKASRPAVLCAIGFALHMYGDTFAHRILPWFNETQGETLYSTGRGHFFDLHYPDDLHCNRIAKDQAGDTYCMLDPPENRFMVWTAYVALTSSLLSGPDPTLRAWDLSAVPKSCAAQPSAFMQKLCNDVQGLVANKNSQTSNADSTDFAAINIIKADQQAYLSEKQIKAGTLVEFQQNAGTADCDTDLGAALTKLGIQWPAGNVSASAQSRCAQAWRTYATVAAAYVRLCEAQSDNMTSVQSTDPNISMTACKGHRPEPKGATWKQLAMGKFTDKDSLESYAARVFPK